jgi:hypothetical protein
LHDLVRFMDKVLVAFVVPFIPINVANLDWCDSSWRVKHRYRQFDRCATMTNRLSAPAEDKYDRSGFIAILSTAVEITQPCANCLFQWGVQPGHQSDSFLSSSVGLCPTAHGRDQKLCLMMGAEWIVAKVAMSIRIMKKEGIYLASWSASYYKVTSGASSNFQVRAANSRCDLQRRDHRESSATCCWQLECQKSGGLLTDTQQSTKTLKGTRFMGVPPRSRSPCTFFLRFSCRIELTVISSHKTFPIVSETVICLTSIIDNFPIPYQLPIRQQKDAVYLIQ